MPETSHADVVHADVRHERSDADVTGLVLFGGGLVLFGVIIHVLVFGVFWRLETDRSATMTAPPPIAEKRARLPRDLDRIPPPRLQVSDRVDMQALLQRDERILQGGRWTDAAGKTHTSIPIEQALEAFADPAVAARHGLKLQPKRGEP